MSDSRQRAMGVRERHELTEIPWQTPQMSRTDRRAIPWLVVGALVMLAVPASIALSEDWPLAIFLLPLFGLIGMGVLLGAMKLPANSRRKLAATQALTQAGTLIPARAIRWTPDDSESGPGGTTLLQLRVPDDRSVVVSHHCHWASCEDAGRRGSTNPDVAVMFDRSTGVWAVVHSGSPQAWVLDC